MVSNKHHVFLLTAVINIRSSNGDLVPCRALLDSGSQSCFITESLAQSLRLSRRNVSVSVHGIGEKPLEVKHATQTSIKSRVSNYAQQVNFLIVPKISSQIPKEEVKIDYLKIPKNVTLADPHFMKPSTVDILIGSEFFLDLIEEPKLPLIGNELFLKSSVFGWLVAGKIQSPINQSCYTVQSLSSTMEDLDVTVRKFWELDSIDPSTQLTSEEQYCEDLFKTTTKRDPDGRFVVKLPTKPNFDQLLDNKGNAVRNFHHLEKRISKDEELQQLYCNFMNEYEKLGHMEQIKDETSSQKCFYMPHHAVLKPTSSTTKLRVVFNASSKASNNLSLNDTLCAGPVVQRDLFSTWIQFRMFK